MDVYSSVPGKQSSRPTNDTHPSTNTENIMEGPNSKKGKSAGSSSESGDLHSDSKPAGTDTETTPRPKTLSTRNSQTALRPAKPRSTAEATSKNMTVETETVNSIPQAALPGATGDRTVLGRGDLSGGLQLKPSIETIRPKKERKKVSRKAPSIASGTGRSQQAPPSQSRQHRLHGQTLQSDLQVYAFGLKQHRPFQAARVRLPLCSRTGHRDFLVSSLLKSVLQSWQTIYRIILIAVHAKRHQKRTSSRPRLPALLMRQTHQIRKRLSSTNQTRPNPNRAEVVITLEHQVLRPWQA